MAWQQNWLNRIPTAHWSSAPNPRSNNFCFCFRFVVRCTWAVCSACCFWWSPAHHACTFWLGFWVCCRWVSPLWQFLQTARNLYFWAICRPPQQTILRVSVGCSQWQCSSCSHCRYERLFLCPGGRTLSILSWEFSPSSNLNSITSLPQIVGGFPKSNMRICCPLCIAAVPTLDSLSGRIRNFACSGLLWRLKWHHSGALKPRILLVLVLFQKLISSATADHG